MWTQFWSRNPIVLSGQEADSRFFLNENQANSFRNHQKWRTYNFLFSIHYWIIWTSVVNDANTPAQFHFVVSLCNSFREALIKLRYWAGRTKILVRYFARFPGIFRKNSVIRTSSTSHRQSDEAQNFTIEKIIPNIISQFTGVVVVIQKSKVKMKSGLHTVRRRLWCLNQLISGHRWIPVNSPGVSKGKWLLWATGNANAGT